MGSSCSTDSGSVSLIAAPLAAITITDFDRVIGDHKKIGLPDSATAVNSAAHCANHRDSADFASRSQPPLSTSLERRSPEATDARNAWASLDRHPEWSQVVIAPTHAPKGTGRRSLTPKHPSRVKRHLPKNFMPIRASGFYSVLPATEETVHQHADMMKAEPHRELEPVEVIERHRVPCDSRMERRCVLNPDDSTITGLRVPPY
jgi:hypothetical protein